MSKQLSTTSNWWRQTARSKINDELAAWYIVKEVNKVPYVLRRLDVKTKKITWSRELTNGRIFFTFTAAREFIQEHFRNNAIEYTSIARCDDNTVDF